MMLWQLLIIFAVFVVAFHWKKKKYMKLSAEFKTSIRQLPFVGHAYLFIGNGEDRMNAFQCLGREAINQGGVSSCWMGYQFFLVIADPEIANFVLRTCLEKASLTHFFRYVSGSGSIFAPVSIWRPRRKILVPAFSSRNLSQSMKVFSKQSNVMVDQLRSNVGKGLFSVWQYFTTYTMDSVFELSLGVEIHAQKNPNQPLLKALEEIFQKLAARFVKPWLYSDTVYSLLPEFKKLIDYRNFVNSVIDELIKSQRKAIKEKNEKLKPNNHNNLKQENPKTFMELMIESSGGDHGYTDLELREEILFLLSAGTDTSAVGLSFTALMLTRYPDIQEKVFKELKQVFGDSQRPVVNDDLIRLKYLEAVIKESLRLYPPVPIVGRTVHQDTTLPSGTTLVAGTELIVNIWAMHRNPHFWGHDAEEFRPDRFLNPNLKHPAQFMPFSFGARDCPGFRYAMASMKIGLATILRQYRLKPATLLETAYNGKSQTHPPLRLRYDIMMKDVNKFQIALESRS